MTMMTPWCERCTRAADLHHDDDGCAGFAPMMLVEHNRRQRVADRRTQALWYVWGREDAGDRRLRDASSDRVLAFDFADFAARECERYVREDTCWLANIADQYRRFVATLERDSVFVCDATGDAYRVDSYVAVANVVFCTVVPGPHGAIGAEPVGGRVSFTPNVLAGYRLLEPTADRLRAASETS